MKNPLYHAFVLMPLALSAVPTVSNVTFSQPASGRAHVTYTLDEPAVVTLDLTLVFVGGAGHLGGARETLGLNVRTHPRPIGGLRESVDGRTLKLSVEAGATYWFRLRRLYGVHDYGAKGDGAMLDTAAIRATATLPSSSRCHRDSSR